MSKKSAARAFALARRQHGVISREDLAAVGVTDGEIRTMVERGSLRRILPRVYAVGGSPGTREQALSSALQWAGVEAALAASTAAEVWGAGGRSPEIELLVPPHVRRRDARFVLHRSASLMAHHVTTRRGLRVTTPERTVLDLAARSAVDDLESIAESMAKAGFLRWKRLVALYEECGGGSGHAGATAMRQLLERRDPVLQPTNRELELATWRVLCASGLPMPERNYRIRVGGEPYELDFAWPEQMVALETDGYGPHSGQVAFRRDRRRLAALVANGWRVLLATWDDVTRAERSRRLVEHVAATLSLTA